MKEKILVVFGVLFFIWMLYNLAFNDCFVTFISTVDCVSLSAFRESGWALIPVAVLGAVVGYWKTRA